jgi:hypothetical protein
VELLLTNTLLCKQLQLEEAVESEDFQEASRLKRAIAAAMEKDTIADVMAELKVRADLLLNFKFEIN